MKHARIQYTAELFLPIDPSRERPGDPDVIDCTADEYQSRFGVKVDPVRDDTVEPIVRPRVR